MGTWGSGVFDSDAGIETYQSYTSRLIEDIERRADDPRLEVEDLDGPLVAAAILGTLGEHAKAIRVEKGRVLRWKERFLAVFDAEIEDLGASEEYVEARRAVIEQVFDRIVRSSYDDTAPPKGPGARGPMNVTRALGATKMPAAAKKAATAGASRGPKKKLPKR